MRHVTHGLHRSDCLAQGLWTKGLGGVRCSSTARRRFLFGEISAGTTLSAAIRLNDKGTPAPGGRHPGKRVDRTECESVRGSY